ncbi:hypothetical protein GW17_00057429 [Ensete ventricosum]|nr:hypothetical protein GW17_00057429 [Ensete ventricosum]RZR90649.1 hypothetical protein BHM03_00018576 [Ensete ventricosum]
MPLGHHQSPQVRGARAEPLPRNTPQKIKSFTAILFATSQAPTQPLQVCPIKKQRKGFLWEGENDGANNSQSNETKNTASPPRPRHDSATSSLRRAPDLTSGYPMAPTGEQYPLTPDSWRWVVCQGTIATTWPTYDQLVYIGINVPLPPLHQGIDSIRSTPDLIIGGTRPSSNSSPWVFCRTYHRPTEETARREEWSCHVTDHGGNPTHTGNLTRVIRYPTLRDDPNK